jgi:hypothetical protein
VYYCHWVIGLCWVCELLVLGSTTPLSAWQG